jgi:hypothetical protein
MRVPDEAAGKKAKCPRCGHVQRAPAEQTPAVVVAEVAEPEPYLDLDPQEPERGRRARLEDEPDDYEDDDRPRRPRRREQEQLTCPRCAAPISADDQECGQCAYDLNPRALQHDLGRLRWTRSLFQGLMFFFVLPGIVMTAVGVVLQISEYPNQPWINAFYGGGTVLILLGVALGAPHKRFNLAWIMLGFLGITGLILLGVALGDPHKGFNLAWMLPGFLGIIGLIILACIPDVKRQRMQRIRRILRADWEARGHGPDERPPWDRSGFPFTLLLGMLGILSAGAIVAMFRLYFSD